MAASRDRTITDLKRQLAMVESNSRHIDSHLKILQREAESLKVEYLKYSLEKQRVAAARERGLALLFKDEKEMGIGLAVAAGGLILGGLIAKDKHIALKASASGLDGVLQGYGETVWVVSLDKQLAVMPCNNASPNRLWVTLMSFIAAINELKVEALQGKQLGTLDDIIHRLQQSEGKLIFLALPN